MTGGGPLDAAGYDVTYETADGAVWATLVPRRNPASRVERYGRGATEAEALARAEERWRVEQVGWETRPRKARDCPACDGALRHLRVRLAPGTPWQGPYYRCAGCGTPFRTLDRRLVPDT